MLVTPAELGASLSPPEFPPATVVVERRLIRSEIVARGTVVFEKQRKLALAGILGLPGSAPVVTRTPSVGDEVQAGGVLIEVAYRPVILLEGERPLVRDLGPGDEGPDVEALQRALAHIDLLEPTGIDGRYGVETGRAVEDLYGRIGYPPPRSSLPMAEVMLLPGTPVTIREVLAHPGQSAAPPTELLRVSGSAAHMVVGVRPFELSEIAVGARVRIHDELSDRVVEGSVSSLGSDPDGDTGLIPVEVAIDGGLAEGRDYRVVLEVEASDGPVLAVPETALYAGSGGASYVLKLGEDMP
ncbi:MAG: HlyD family efflux transporter periplasmic adaptor subunit, partial [Acidimicrobiia bacterium]